MDSSTSEVAHDFHPWFRIYKDGRIQRFLSTPLLPPSDDPNTGVQSKDVLISPEPKVSARLFLPKIPNPHHKLPLLIYIHGGAFSIESAFSSIYHNYLNALVAETNVIAVSIEYRLAPEHPVPACYEDSWTVMKWMALHAKKGQGSEPWLNDHADFGRVFLAGDSAGANIAHNMVVRADADGLDFGVKIVGVVLVHPFFGNDKPSKFWMFISQERIGVDDPMLNPASDPSLLSKLGCSKLLICTASKDFLRDRGWSYYEALRKSGWGGVVEIVETEDEEHVFHLLNPTSEKAGTLMKLVASFLHSSE